MKVWIDQELCTGDGQCADICPEVFFMHDDGRTYRAHVRNAEERGGMASVPLIARTGSGRGGRRLPRSVHLRRARRLAARGVGLGGWCDLAPEDHRPWSPAVISAILGAMRKVSGHTRAKSP